MGKEQTGREGKEGGLTTNEARKSNFREGKGGSQPSGGREQNHRPQNIAVHLMARGGGNPGASNKNPTKIRGLGKSLYTKLVRTSQDTVINIHRVQRV